MKVHVCLSLVLSALLASFTFAQSDTPTHEVSTSYSFLAEEFGKNRTGWVASFSETVNSRIWIKAEAGGSYRKQQIFDGRHPDFIHSILAGPEFKLRPDSKLVPWAHVLAGITINNYAEPLIGTSSIFGPSVRRRTDVRFGFQPGGGVDYYLTPGFGVRIGADYRRALSGFTDTDFFRLQSGVVVRFGS